MPDRSWEELFQKSGTGSSFAARPVYEVSTACLSESFLSFQHALRRRIGSDHHSSVSNTLAGTYLTVSKLCLFAAQSTEGSTVAGTLSGKIVGMPKRLCSTSYAPAGRFTSFCFALFLLQLHFKRICPAAGASSISTSQQSLPFSAATS